MNNISKRLRLRDNHPTAVKLQKLCNFADELGISLSFHGQRVVLEDRDRNKDLPPIFVEDIEDDHWFSEFPFFTEYKLVHDNPEYLAHQKREAEERKNKEREEQIRLNKAKEEKRNNACLGMRR